MLKNGHGLREACSCRFERLMVQILSTIDMSVVIESYLYSLSCRHSLLEITNHPSNVGKHEQRYDDEHNRDSDFPETKYAGMHDQKMFNTHLYQDRHTASQNAVALTIG